MDLPPAARVLLVDDDLLVLDAVKGLLEALGYSVHASSSPYDALEDAGREAFDVLVTDVQMPGMIGPDLVAELRRRGSTLPVLYITGYVSGEAVREHAWPRLEKPFSAEELMAAIAAVAPRP